MGSTDRETRVRQKAEAEAQVAGIAAKLKENGLDDKKLARVPIYRQAVAVLKKAESRIKALDAKAALNQTLAEKKAAGKDKVKDKSKKGAKAQDAGKPKKKAKAKAK